MYKRKRQSSLIKNFKRKCLSESTARKRRYSSARSTKNLKRKCLSPNITSGSNARSVKNLKRKCLSPNIISGSNVIDLKMLGGQSKIVVVNDCNGSKDVYKYFFNHEHFLIESEIGNYINNIKSLANSGYFLDYHSFNYHHSLISMEYLDIVDGWIEGWDYVNNYAFWNMSASNTKFVVSHVAKAIKLLHDHEIAHLDLKLENLMFKCNPSINHSIEQVKLIDFGMSTYDIDCCSKTIKGTDGYRPPECIVPTSPNGIVEYNPYLFDIWSLGITTCLLVSGVAPYYDDDKMLEYIENDNAIDGSPIEKLHFWREHRRPYRPIVVGMTKMNPHQRWSIQKITNTIDKI
jgi:serine/threonine protein kinase